MDVLNEMRSFAISQSQVDLRDSDVGSEPDLHLRGDQQVSRPGDRVRKPTDEAYVSMRSTPPNREAVAGPLARGGCYACGQHGHIKAHCPAQRQNTECFECHQIGHIRACCPQLRGTQQHQQDQMRPHSPCQQPVIPSNKEEIFFKQKRGAQFEKLLGVKSEVTAGPQGAPNVIQPVLTSDLHPFHDHLRQSLSCSQYDRFTPIQQYVIPAMLGGYDVFGVSQTGSGKTVAYLLPVVEHLLRTLPERTHPVYDKVVKPFVLVVTPTRELANQVWQDAVRLCYFTKFRCQPATGGVSFGGCVRELQKGTHILVATPGRLLQLLKERVLSLAEISFLIIDEADELFAGNFFADLHSVIYDFDLPPVGNRQLALLGATAPADFQMTCQQFLNENYVYVSVGLVDGACCNVQVNQKFIHIKEEVHKDLFQIRKEQLDKLLEKFSGRRGRVLVFANRCGTVDRVHEYLDRQGYGSVALTSRYSMRLRNQAVDDFRRGVKQVLVASSLASRGLDFPAVDLVVNFDTPQDEIDYVHRIGRTARAGNEGDAVTFYDTLSSRSVASKLKRLLETAGQPIPDFLTADASFAGSNVGVFQKSDPPPPKLFGRQHNLDAECSGERSSDAWGTSDSLALFNPPALFPPKHAMPPPTSTTHLSAFKPTSRSHYESAPGLSSPVPPRPQSHQSATPVPTTAVSPARDDDACEKRDGDSWWD